MPWQVFTFDVPQKTTPVRLEWRYSKDSALSVENELVAIDNLDIRIAPPAPPGPGNLTIGVTETGLRIIAEGPTNSDFLLESTTDFVTWTPAPDGEQNSGATGVVVYNVSATGEERFFRVNRL